MVRSPRPRNRTLLGSLRHLGRNTRGATAVEYGLILALIALAAMGAILEVAKTTTGMWNNINAEVTRAR